MSDEANAADAPATPHLSPRSAWLLLLIPLGWFLWTGARGIDFGEHWDEGYQVQLLEDAISNETLLPGWYNYPSTSFALSILALAPELLTSDLSGLETQNPRAIGAPVQGLLPVQARLLETIRAPSFLLRMRTVFLWVSALSILGVFLASRAASARSRSDTRGSVGAWEALFAAGILATSFELGYHARWVAPDALLAAWTALFLAALARTSRGQGCLICLGLLAGLATGTKYTGGLLLLPLLMCWWRTAPERSPRRLCAALAAFVGAFLITTPGALLQPARFFRDIAFERYHYSLHHYGFTVESGLEHLGLNLRWLTTDLGSPYTALALCLSFLALTGAVAAWRRDRFEAALLLIVPITWLLFFSSQNVLFVRNLLPIAPFFALLAARGLAYIAAALPEKTRPLAAALGAAILVANGAFAYSASESIRNQASNDPTAELLIWLESERGERTVYLSEQLARELHAKLGGHLPEGCTADNDAPADLAAFRPQEIAKDAHLRPADPAGNLKSNLPGCLLASFGPRGVNWEWYTTWRVPRIVVVERSLVETLRR
jgi:hypothetical protein